MSLKGLVIRQPWIGMILRGEKSWEMRSTPCRHRGPIALIEQGSGTVVGMAEIVDDLPPLSASDLSSTFNRHRIPPEQIGEAIHQGWVRPWVLANIKRLSLPVPYQHPSGAVKWVNLPAEVEAAVIGKSSAGSHSNAAAYYTGSSVTAEHADIAQRRRREICQGLAKVKIPTEVSTSISLRGNKLYIDVEWEDGLPSGRRKSSEWAEVIGIFAALVAAICMFGFIIHFPLGVMSSSISAMSAFKWLVPMLAASLVAAVLGQSELLEDAFQKR